MRQVYVGLKLVLVAAIVAHVLLALEIRARGDDAACMPTDASCAASTINELNPAANSALLTTSDFFLRALNSVRVEHGLQPVLGSAILENAAAINNQAQVLHNQCGHHFTGGFGQCAAQLPTGSMSPESAMMLWMESPAHRALIMAPNLSMVGYHQAGPFATVATYQGGVARQVFSKPDGYRAAGNMLVSPPAVPSGFQCTAPNAVTGCSIPVGAGPGACWQCDALPARRGFRLFRWLRNHVRFNVQISF